MNRERRMPDEPLAFIKACVDARQVYWTHHAGTRMLRRGISREMLLETGSTYEIIEAYPDDKYLPSYLVLFKYGDEIFHAVFAVDTDGSNVRVITIYAPDPERWDDDLRKRGKP